ncbi:MAG: PQQ-binding-like beta-propeller repeat protein [Verrucomicrobiia bacterium]
MLAHDAARSGATPTEIQPPFERKWHRLFPDEGILSGGQPVVAEGKVFIGTLRGTLHAIDAASGKDVWTYRCRGAVLHAAAAGAGKVFVGSADGAVTALKTADGTVIWEVQTGSAVWNSPALHESLLLIGSRDQQLYAIRVDTGDVVWSAPTGGPLLGSPAVDARRGRVYIGSEDMHVYAYDLKQGQLVWRSPKLPGVSLRGYHPVIAPDGAVLVTTAPGVSVDTFQALLLEMTKAIFGDFASWRHSSEANAVLREDNFALMDKPETYQAQMDYLRKRLKAEPALQTFFVLDPQTGRQRFVAPIVYSESMNGPGAPALVSTDGRVLVKYQALLRSRYEHYSPFLNVGQLDTATGDIRPVMDQTRTYGWFDSLLLVHDEQSQLALAGNILINTHQDNVNGLDLRNLEGFLKPFCRNIHEPKPGEALAIWTRLLRNEALPQGKEWLARGTAVYGGGSVLDTAVSVAGNSFYYLPTHELSAGVGLIAYRMDPNGTASEETTLAPPELRGLEWQTIQKLPWDWDSLEYRRLSHVLEALPGKVPGTRLNPLTKQANEAVAAVKEADLDRLIWDAPGIRPQGKPSVYVSGLKNDLTLAVGELISHDWQPLVFPAGKFPEEAYRLFTDPAETLYTLALAYRHLDRNLQPAVNEYVRRLFAPGGLLESPAGRRTRPSNVGEVRSQYDPPPEKLLRFQDDVSRTDLARLYPLWLWAHVSGDWTKLEADWPRLASLVNQRPNKMEEDCRNGHIAGLIAFCRIASHMNDAPAVEAGTAATKRALRERLEFEFAHTRGGLIWQIPKLRSAFSRWHFLTPEVGRLLARHVKAIHVGLMGTYVDYHRPTWWLAWNVETLVRNECPYEFPSASADIFAARALVLGEPAEKLAPFIDRPWCLADEYYIQKLALTLDAALPQTWADMRSGKAP